MSKTKAKARQLEIIWAMPEAFALAIQVTLDGDRVTREQQQQAADRKALVLQ
jgi:hypothetical protein